MMRFAAGNAALVDVGAQDREGERSNDASVMANLRTIMENPPSRAGVFGRLAMSNAKQGAWFKERLLVEGPLASGVLSGGDGGVSGVGLKLLLS